MIEDAKNRVEEFKKNINEIKKDDTFSEKFPDVVKTIISGIRIGTRLVSIPVIFGLKVTSKLMPVVWETAVQVIHIPAALISKTINKNSPYNGKKINKMGEFLGNTTEKLFNSTADIVETVAKHI